MRRVKPVVANTAEQLAAALALPAAEVKEWQVQHELAARLGEIARKQTPYARADCRAFGNLPHQGDRDIEWRPGACIDGPPDPHSRVTRVQGESVGSEVGDCGVGQFAGPPHASIPANSHILPGTPSIEYCAAVAGF